MNDDVSAMAHVLTFDSDDLPHHRSHQAPEIPDYLEETYWWAYLRPQAVWLFEREWLVNLILWGNMRRLTDAVLDELDLTPYSSVLQVACVYGDFSNRLATHLASSDSQLDVLDIAPIQLNNTRSKLSGHLNVKLHHQDSGRMQFYHAEYNQTVLFFLLHEQPEDVRCKTLAEAIRVTRPGGKVTIIDYCGPSRINPMRYLMYPVLRFLEPYALDLWRTPLSEYLPAGISPERLSSQLYFGGLYQKMVIHC